MKRAAELWMGRTQHTRHAPFSHNFSYGVAMVSVDVDRLADADRLSRFFSVDKANLVSFRQREFALGERPATLRAWAEAKLAEAGVSGPIASVHLLSFPNVMGHGFAPISVWVARDGAGRISGVIYEVHNTFGEAHAYVLGESSEGVAHEAEKQFHVSPFFDVSGTYRFQLMVSADAFALVVENHDQGERIHTASLSLRARDLNDRTVLSWLLRMPFSGFGVILGIHWQALKLWFKGAKYRSKPAQRAGRTTRATSEAPSTPLETEYRRSA